MKYSIFSPAASIVIAIVNGLLITHDYQLNLTLRGGADETRNHDNIIIYDNN